MIEYNYILDNPEILGSIIGVLGVFLVTRNQIGKMQEQLDFEKDKEKYKNLPLLKFSETNLFLMSSNNVYDLNGSLLIHNVHKSSSLFNLTLFSMTKNDYVLEKESCIHILSPMTCETLILGWGNDKVIFKETMDIENQFSFGICSAISKNILFITYIMCSKDSDDTNKVFCFDKKPYTLFLEKKEKWEILNPINKVYIENDKTTYHIILQLAEEYKSRLN